MAKNAQPSKRARGTVSGAWRKKDELKVVEAVITKYAKVLDMTDSGRDIKPLASGLFEAIDRRNALLKQKGETQKETPLYRILDQAVNGKAVNE